MIPCLNQATIGGGQTIEEYVATAAQAGYGGGEFGIESVADLAERTSETAAKELFASHGVAAGSFGLPVEFRQDDAAFEGSIERLPVLAALAERIGCSRCCTWIPPTVEGSAQEFRANMVVRLRESAKILGDHGIGFGIEWVAPKTARASGNPVIYTMDGALDLAADIREGNVGLLVDSWHWHCMGGTREDLERLSVDQIVHVHINDAADQPIDTLLDNVRLLPGEGVIDLVTFLRVLREKGYPGYLAIETFSEELPKLGHLSAAKKAKAALDSVLARV